MAKRLRKSKQPRKATPKTKSKDAERQRRSRRNNPLSCLLRDARYRSKKAGISFTVEADDLLPLPETCPLLGIRLHVADGQADDGSYSLDRIDPRGPYDAVNTRVISWKANRLRNDGSNFDLMRVALADQIDHIPTDDECRELALYLCEMRRR